MGRATVRAQIATYFAPANVAGLSTTYRARPKEIPGQAFNLSANGGSGAVLVIHLPDDEVRRVTLGPAGTGSQKFDVHQVALELMFRSVKPDAQVAQDDHDALVDALMARFRADPTFGSTNLVPIWSAGETPFGVKKSFTEPKLSKQEFVCNGVIRFEAQEVVIA